MKNITTPQMLRKAIKKEGLPIIIAKKGGSWYVLGDKTLADSDWFDFSLNTYRLDNRSVDSWIKEIKELIPSKY